MQKSKSLVQNSFNKAAGNYDKHASFQRQVHNILMNFAQQNKPAHTIDFLLDGGCGTGCDFNHLIANFNPKKSLGLDFAHNMLEQFNQQNDNASICADLENIPLKDNSVDLFWSNLAIQWCTPHLALQELWRTLSPGSCAFISTLGVNTLYEIKNAFLQIDKKAHVLDFFNQHYWQQVARHVGFKTININKELVVFEAQNLKSLLKQVKSIGANQIKQKRKDSLMGKNQWQAIVEYYEQFRQNNGMLPMSYEVILLHLQK